MTRARTTKQRHKGRERWALIMIGINGGRSAHEAEQLNWRAALHETAPRGSMPGSCNLSGEGRETGVRAALAQELLKNAHSAFAAALGVQYLNS